MAIQVGSFLLTEVERALGIYEWEQNISREHSLRGEWTMGTPYKEHRSPRHKRTRPRESGEKNGRTTPSSRGLLSPAMIKMKVYEIEGGTGGRRGKIGSLRKKMKRVKKELERSIHR
ncbi:hypothetical protein BDV23DRAFT_183165 [Aspergillus alliaceus]|uniref:Uncharacterized protein n=1 Tax=Petromyces alliaceus TaxID=209559 RepID=A0A5N7C9Q8_PETAA|nr:hypothetical protein BDV23DRAFT_183165 [Aspergillus alliaceus]